MKIAIPVEEKSLGTNVCVSFGRTPYFAVYDTETQETAFLENSAAESQGGAGIKAAQLMVDQAVQGVITVRLGENAAEVLQAAEIKLYRSVFGSVEKNIEEWLAGNLNPLTEIHAGFHHHGG